MKWKELDGQERWQVLELMRKGDVPVKEICERFGVSRQTLYRAMDKADEAARKALTPRSPGRKGPSEGEAEQTRSKAEIADLQKELGRWKTKYEAAQAFLELERRYDRGERPTTNEEQGTTASRKKKAGRKSARRVAKRRRGDRE